MTRLALLVIWLATPPREREWVVGDTVEELARIRDADGERAARRWVRREMWRVLVNAPRHRLAVACGPVSATSQPAINKGDGPVRDFFQDIRCTLRLLGRGPAFTAIAIATLALGIGANTAIFAVVNAVLLKPLPFADAERLMLVHMLVPERERPGVYNESVWSYPKYRTLTASQQVFDEIAFFQGRDLDLSGDGEPQRVRGEVVTEQYPSVVGVAPLMGRPFTWDEVHTAGPSRAAMIMTAVGIVIGAALALLLTRLLAALLYGVESGDPATFVSVAVLLGVIALAAGYIPARRATRVDAIAALRAE